MRLPHLAFAAAITLTAASYANAQACGKVCTSDFWAKATSVEIAQALASVDVNARGEYGWTPLHFAASLASREPLLMLLKAGADVNARATSGTTPLHLAITAENIIVLLMAGADAKARDDSGDTPLHHAVMAKGPEGVIALLKAGADVNARNTNGTTPLHKAVLFAEREGVIAALLNAGADVNAKEDGIFSFTPLHYAAFQGTPKSVMVLLKAGANANAKADDAYARGTSEGSTPWDLAQVNKALKGTDAYWALNDARFK